METSDLERVHNFDREFICVEYPAVVENTENMLKTLGGISNISTTYSQRKRRLELRFRPDDVYCKPACGDKHRITGLLLKIKVVRKNTQDNRETRPGESTHPKQAADTKCSVAVMGRIEIAYRFKNLCDFQYLPMARQFDSHGPLKCVYDQLVPKGLPDTSWLAGEAPYFLPPAAFSRMDNMQAYLYRREARDDTSTPHNIIGRTRRRRSGHAVFVTFDIPEIPKAPRNIACKLLRLKFLNGDHYSTMKKIFEERPVWSKNALLFNTKLNSDQLKYLLPAVAYYFVTGPWRIMWVRFGYDPRKHPESRKYQTLDYRLRTVGGLKTLVKAKRSYCNYVLPYKSSPSCRPKTAVISKEVLQEQSTQPEVEEGLNENMYVFRPGMVPPSRQMFYQYCDVFVPEIQEMIEKLPTPPPGAKCHERYGWMPPRMDEQCREILNRIIIDTLKQEPSASQIKKERRPPKPSAAQLEKEGESSDEDTDEACESGVSVET